MIRGVAAVDDDDDDDDHHHHDHGDGDQDRSREDKHIMCRAVFMRFLRVCKYK